MANRQRVPGRESVRVAADAAPGGAVRVLAPAPAGDATVEATTPPGRGRHLAGSVVIVIGLAAVVLFGGGDRRTPEPASTLAPLDGSATVAPKGPATTETEVPAGLDLDPRIDLWWNAAGDQMAFIDDPDGAGALTVGPAHDLSVVGFAVGSLAWHPTDSRLAFVAEDFSGVADRWLFVVVAGRDLRSDGLVERQIALDSGEVAIAAWGDWGYLLEAQEGGRTVFVMRSLDGRNRGEPVPLRPSHGAPKAPRSGWP